MYIILHLLFDNNYIDFNTIINSYINDNNFLNKLPNDIYNNYTNDISKRAKQITKKLGKRKNITT